MIGRPKIQVPPSVRADIIEWYTTSKYGWSKETIAIYTGLSLYTVRQVLENHQKAK